jgi:hypothetical protein
MGKDFVDFRERVRHEVRRCPICDKYQAGSAVTKAEMAAKILAGDVVSYACSRCIRNASWGKYVTEA